MYVAVNSADFKRLTEGEAEASDIEELERMLIERGLLLVDARPAKKWRIFKHAISMNDNERAEFLESVGEMLESGIPIGEALEEMIESEVKQKTASSRLAEKLFDGVTRGEPLSVCVAREAWEMDPISAGLIQAGETSGDMGTALLCASKILRRRVEVKSKILRALIGPLLTSLAALTALGVWIIYLVPRFIAFLADAGVKPPEHITFLGEISRLCTLHWQLILGIGLGITILLLLILRVEAAKMVISRYVGWIFAAYRMSERVQLLAMIGGLYRAGISLDKAVDLSASTAADPILKKDLDRVSRGLHLGKSFGDMLCEFGLFPQQTLKIVRIGEKSGMLGAALLRAESLLSKRLQKRIDSLLGALPQVLILIMGGMFAAMVCGVVLPIYDAVSTIQ